MNRTEALMDLLSKVGAGDAIDKLTAVRAFYTGGSGALASDASVNAKYANTGSLDAAKALHEAVLPGFFWQRQGFVMTVTDDHTGWGNGTYGRARDDDNPARAWLIAILRALIVEETNKERTVNGGYGGGYPNQTHPAKEA